ncbi:MAG: phosphate signaling complex protein PhoU [SAR202 cluster bacterium]|nr:phosphate signaling complex protein PhoU [SAR202 cluster bacterium]
MPRLDFDRSLRILQDELLALGSMVEKAVINSVDSLKRRDLELSRQVVQQDDVIDKMRYEIEEKCIDLIAKQQPFAQDLRTVIATLHIAVELERMGDYAEGIAKISLLMGDQAPLKPLIDIPRMADKATKMLRRALDALVNRDVVAAKVVCNDDDEVDALYDQVYRELLTFMIQDPKTIQRATYLLWVAHDLERTADRATNIAERVIYLVTGKLVELNVGKG